ncbi:hypothetical protein ACFE04_019559 [Oxalis oulophora]
MPFNSCERKNGNAECDCVKKSIFCLVSTLLLFQHFLLASDRRCFGIFSIPDNLLTVVRTLPYIEWRTWSRNTMTHFLREYAIKLSPRVSATFFLNIIESKLRIRRNVRAAKKERMGGGRAGKRARRRKLRTFFPSSRSSALGPSTYPTPRSLSNK